MKRPRSSFDFALNETKPDAHDWRDYADELEAKIEDLKEAVLSLRVVPDCKCITCEENLKANEAKIQAIEEKYK